MKKDVVGLRRQMAMSSSQEVFVTPQDVSEKTGQLFGTLHSQKIQIKKRESVMELRRSEMWLKSKTS